MPRFMMGVLGGLLLVLVGGSASLAQSAPPGSYQQTCRSIQVRNDVLTASCEDTSGNWRNTPLYNFGRCRGDIANDDGNLRCSHRDSGTSSYTSSYAQTCRDVRRSGNRIEATCQKKNGEWRQTSMDDVSRCSGQIVNDDGNLLCSYGDYGAPGSQPGYQGSDVAYDTGYQDGLREGAEDQRTGHSNRPHEHAAWKDADHNLSTVNTNPQDYKNRYREGYERGYRDGYGQQGYGPQGYQSSDVAYDTGYQDGQREGAEDRRTGHSFRPHEHAAWQDADHNLSTVHTDPQEYKNRYRQGYERGYQEGYGR